MNIYISREGSQSGPFSEAQLRSMLSAHLISPDDLAWQDGQSTWELIRKVLDLRETTPPVRARPNAPAQSPYRYTFSVDLSSVDPAKLDDLLGSYPRLVSVVAHDGKTRVYAVETPSGLGALKMLIQKKFPEVRGDGFSNKSQPQPRSQPRSYFGQFVAWVTALTIAAGLGVILAKCSPDSDPDYKAGRDFAFQLRNAEKYAWGKNESLSEGQRDEMARAYVPKSLSEDRQQTWKEGFKSGL